MFSVILALTTLQLPPTPPTPYPVRIPRGEVPRDVSDDPRPAVRAGAPDKPPENEDH